MNDRVWEYELEPAISFSALCGRKSSRKQNASRKNLKVLVVGCWVRCWV